MNGMTKKKNIATNEWKLGSNGDTDGTLEKF